MRILLFFLIFALPSLVYGQGANEKRDYVTGTGNSLGGNITTYVDPQTGDIVTSVKPPKDDSYYNQNNQHNPYNQGNMPIFVYPEVNIGGAAPRSKQ